MILDTIENFLRYARRSEKSLLAYDFIMNYQKNPLPCGRYTLDENRCYAIVEEYTPTHAENKDFLSHTCYTTMQYVVKGREAVLWSSPERLPKKSTDEQQDETRYGGGENASTLHGQAGDFLVLYPQDAYKSGCCEREDETQPVTKLTIKMLIE